jgi:hypothetical protein
VSKRWQDVVALPTAQALLTSRIPARLAFLGGDGAPRVVPIWSHWDGSELVLGTFAGTAKLAAITDGSMVAVTIDSESFPYQGLQLRGSVSVTPLPGLVPEYVLAAHRYLGEEESGPFLARLDGKAMVRIALQVRHAHLLDMRA